MSNIYNNRKLYLIIIILLGILIRAGFLVTPIIDSDQATFGLQGRHILLGEFPIFSWGYAYMGTLQSYLDGLAFYVFGANSLVLNGVTTLLSIFFILATYLLGKEIFDNPLIPPFNSPLSKGGYRGVKGGHGGILSALFAAVGPAYLTIHGAWARHGYMETLIFGSLMLLISIRLSRAEEGKDRARLFIILGSISGLAFWTNFLIIVYLPACGFYLLLRDRKIFRKETLLTVPSFLLGSLPFWIYNLTHSFASLGIIGAGKKEPFIKNLEGAIFKGVPEMIGANSVNDTILYGFYFIIVSIFIISAILLILSGIKDLLRKEFRVQSSEFGEKRDIERNGIGIILLFFLSFFVIYSASSFGGSSTGTMRYLLPLHSALPLLAVLFLDRIEKHSKRLMILIACLVFFVNLFGNIKSYDFLDRKKLIQYRERKEIEKSLFEFLKKKGIFHVYVLDYWIGPRLTFEAKEEIIFSLPEKIERFPKYVSILNDSNKFAYVLSQDNPGNIKVFDDNLRAMGIDFKRGNVKGYTIFNSFSYIGFEEVPRNNWKALSEKGNNAIKAFDGDIETAWFSGEPKKDGMWFKIDLGSIQKVSGISILPGLIGEGNMNGYSVEVSKDGRLWELVRRVDKNLIPWLDWSNGGPRYSLYHPRVKAVFEPVDSRYIKITHHGEDKYYNWTIAELFVYKPVQKETHPYDEIIEEGRLLESKGDYRGAAKKYLDVIKSYGDIEEAYYRLMALMQDLHIPFGPIYEKAEAFESGGLIEKAIENYENEYLRLYPSGSYSSVLLNRLAVLYEKAGDIDKSDYYKKRLNEEFSPSEKRSVNFGGLIEFLGYDIRQGSVLEITYYWKAAGEIKRDWNAFVHFVCPDGRVAFQNDHLLFSNERPSSKWVKGEVYKESLKVEVPENIRTGVYEIKIGVFDPKAEKRLKVKTGLFKKKDGIVIGELRIN